MRHRPPHKGKNYESLVPNERTDTAWKEAYSQSICGQQANTNLESTAKIGKQPVTHYIHRPIREILSYLSARLHVTMWEPLEGFHDIWCQSSLHEVVWPLRLPWGSTLYRLKPKQRTHVQTLCTAGWSAPSKIWFWTVHGGNAKGTQTFGWKTLNGRDQLENLNANGRAILKWSLWK